jgi:glycosyltransferase involved in cell wall biosynthesis
MLGSRPTDAMVTRARILVVQPVLEPVGGGSAVCAWILEALKGEHEVALVGLERPDFAAVNRFFGTSLEASEIAVHVALPWLRPGLRRHRALRRLKYWLFLAAVRRMPRYDLLISTEEESDLGGRGIQYLHFPRLPRIADEPLLRRLHYRAIAAVTGTSLERMRANVTVVNSDWTGAAVRALHGLDSVTIRPPAAGPIPEVPWSERAPGFVCVGRFAPEKRFEDVIDILARVRARGHDLRLRIVGSPTSDDYRAQVLARAAAHADWVTIVEDLSRDDLAALFARNRYGIHGMREEHYGMVVAEMVRAGAVVFVPRGGGQVEIVGDDRLTFADHDEAADKIVRVLEDRALEESVRSRLAARRAELGPERFVEEIRALVRRTLAG